MDFGIPTNFVSNVASTTTSGLSSMGGVTELLTGLLLAFLVADILIGMFLVKGTFDE